MTPANRARIGLLLAAMMNFTLAGLGALGADKGSVAQFHQTVEPLLQQHCYDCHGDGQKKGNLEFDDLKSDDAILNHDLWTKVLVNVRCGLMPPEKEPRLTAAEQKVLEDWVKYQAFGIDRNAPPPGRGALRRLNQLEYRNTIRDLMGVDFKTGEDFPPDDLGEKLQYAGETVAVPPLWLEKYRQAAAAIVAQALPAREKNGSQPKDSGRFFTKEAPQRVAARRQYAREILEKFLGKAYRRPVEARIVDQAVAEAEGVYTRPGKTFEDGVGQAMISALSSPQFLIRHEQAEPTNANPAFALVDEYDLAARLSYFLWSSMPDDDLLRLAGTGQLRANLPAQVKRMIQDPRAEALVTNFLGHWLAMHNAKGKKTCDIQNVKINPQAALAREHGEEMAKNAPTKMDSHLRQDMARETELVFATVLRENRSVKEFLESDYTFLNENLAVEYGLTNLGVRGPELRRVTLPPDSMRGGLLTEGTILAVTSHPDRGSPTRRGMYLLNTILSCPLAPRPANATEEELQKLMAHGPTARQALQEHLVRPGCNDCHLRLDPLGLAFENFNALGQWRDRDGGQPIDASGHLITGENFQNVRELKHILASNHHQEFYRTLTTKMLSYAVGRKVDYHDTETVDQIVQRMESDDGRIDALLTGVIESAPFQDERSPDADALAEPSTLTPEWDLTAAVEESK